MESGHTSRGESTRNLLNWEKKTNEYLVNERVEPVLSGTVLSGHPPLSGQLSKSRKLCPFILVILTSIKRSPLLSGRGHPLLSPNELFLLS